MAPDRQLSVRQRVEAIAYLEAIATQLNTMAAALAERGAWTEADMVDASAKSLLAGCWWLDRPLRAQRPPERWTYRDGMSAPSADLRLSSAGCRNRVPDDASGRLALPDGPLVP
jgi:hypothetical protein